MGYEQASESGPGVKEAPFDENISPEASTS